MFRVLLKINFHGIFNVFQDYFMFLLPLIRKFLEAKRRRTLFLSPQVPASNIGSPLFIFWRSIPQHSLYDAYFFRRPNLEREATLYRPQSS